MKLLFCLTCNDLFKLDTNLRQCKCGLCKGKYLSDGLHAEVNGNGVSIAINNFDLMAKLREFIFNGTSDDPYNTYQFDTWFRKHTGDHNKHTIINKNL